MTKHSSHHPTSHQTRINGLNLHYHLAGNPDKQLVIFFHGWGIRPGFFGHLCGIHHVIRHLAKDFYVIAPELPGLNRSETPIDGRHSAMTSIVYQLIRSIGPPKPAILIGHSFGGTIATLYAHQHPAEVKKLILINTITHHPSPFITSPLLLWWVNNYQRILQHPSIPTSFKKIAINLFFGTPLLHITTTDIQRKANLENPLTPQPAINYSLLRTPTVIVWGSNDKKIPSCTAKKIAQRIPNGKYLEIKGGHSILHRQPRSVIHTLWPHIK